MAGRVHAGDRIPPGYEQARRERPDQAILREAGFEAVRRREFSVVHDWTAATLAGFVMSTSVLSPAALGGLAGDFAEDLRRVLSDCGRAGPFRQRITFACDLARRPG